MAQRAAQNHHPGRQEDPGAEDLGPDPTWNRVHSTPAGGAHVMLEDMMRI